MVEVDSDEWRSSADMDISTQLYTRILQLQKATTESKKLFSYFFLIIVREAFKKKLHILGRQAN